MFVQFGKKRFKAKHSYGIIGLMFSKKKNLLFVNRLKIRYDLHMLFVFFPIDIVFVSNGKVVEKKRAYPFQPFIKGVKCDYAVEISEKNKIKMGDKFKIL